MSMASHDKGSRKWTGFINSFRFAFEGIVSVVRKERNMKIHLCLSVLVIIMGIGLSISLAEWMIIILAMGGVLSAEMMNSAIEKAVDLFTKDYHPLAKLAKDMAAGAVLVFAIASVAIGLLIFGPKLIALFG